MPHSGRDVSGEEAQGMMRQELIDYIAQSHDDIARLVREAMQPIVDAFANAGALWPVEMPHERRHIMRSKIRRCYR